MFNKRATDPVHPDLDGLLVKNKNLLAEVYGLSENKTLWESLSSIKVGRKNSDKGFQVSSQFSFAFFSILNSLVTEEHLDLNLSFAREISLKIMHS